MQTADTQIPKSVGDTELPPVPLGAKMAKMCTRLDALHTLGRHKGLPSDMVRGAVFIARSELRKNPDWLAQAAHSLRDTLYPFLSPKVGGSQKTTIQALKQFGSVINPETTVPRMGRLFGELSNIAHHGVIPTRSFEELLAEFEAVLAEALSRQSDIHADIDTLLALDPNAP